MSGRLMVEQPSAVEFANLLAHICTGNSQPPDKPEALLEPSWAFLKANRSGDDIGLVAELLQYIPDDLLEDLLVLYNGVLREGCVPHSWDGPPDPLPLQTAPRSWVYVPLLHDAAGASSDAAQAAWRAHAAFGPVWGQWGDSLCTLAFAVEALARADGYLAPAVQEALLCVYGGDRLASEIAEGARHLCAPPAPVPPTDRGAAPAPEADVLRALRAALHAGLARIRDDPDSPAGWGLFLLAPRMLLFRRRGETRVARDALEERAALLARGAYADLLDQAAAAAALAPVASPAPRGDCLERRAARAAALAHMGELSAAAAALTAPALAPATAATLAELRDPARRPPSPQVPLPAPPALGRETAGFGVDHARLLANLRRGRRGAAPGLSGCTPEHLRVLLDDAESLDLLCFAADRLARAEVPPEALAALRLGRLVALQKPAGGVRGLLAAELGAPGLPGTQAARLAAAALHTPGWAPPSWVALASGLDSGAGASFGDPTRGWQRAATAALDRQALEVHFSVLDPASRALLLSQGGAGGAAALTPGAAAADAAARKRRETYPEFAQAPRARLAVLALETGGRRGDDCEHFLRVLAAGRAQAAPPWQRPGLRAALHHRWGSLLSLAAQGSLATTLLELPE
ncbi:unnamed protein product [Durusdinium trenchii]|uniref:Nuclear pore complex protein Nup85 n=1 Tax=Durusdinium trenchii TaxID=1381693 RepID=A0ABP0IRX6_9DINO